MTKTQAAEAIAIQVRVFARKTNQDITMLLVEELVSEYRGHGWDGMALQEMANMVSCKTVLRLAKEF